MTETMLTRMARAMAYEWASSDHEEPEALALAEEDWPEWVGVAKAALEAIREPETEVLRAMDAESYPDSGSYTKWTAGIDAILLQGEA